LLRLSIRRGHPDGICVIGWRMPPKIRVMREAGWICVICVICVRFFSRTKPFPESFLRNTRDIPKNGRVKLEKWKKIGIFALEKWKFSAKKP
jgi:hypothetical protein